ncbi:hypothetical protein J3R74_000257 [Puniceicoccus vermicola]
MHKNEKLGQFQSIFSGVRMCGADFSKEQWTLGTECHFRDVRKKVLEAFQAGVTDLWESVKDNL